MDGAGAKIRMVDEFVAAFERLGKSLPVAPDVCGGFADLCWQPYPWETEKMEAFERDEPAFVIRTGLHQVAFHRVNGEIRYFAGPDPTVAKLFSQSEVGLLDSVDDAARLTAAYLEGVELNEIDVPRRLPQWAVEGRRERERVWGPIDPAAWRSVPCTTGRVATPDDVDEGRAVFVLRYKAPSQAAAEPPRSPRYGITLFQSGSEPGGVTPIDIPLPRCVLLHEDGEAHPAVAIQAERTPRGTNVGVRFIRGHWAIRPLEALEWLDGPTDAFFDEHRQALARAAAKPVWSNA